jgi:hypothetical protein
MTLLKLVARCILIQKEQCAQVGVTVSKVLRIVPYIHDNATRYQNLNNSQDTLQNRGS